MHKSEAMNVRAQLSAATVMVVLTWVGQHASAFQQNAVAQDDNGVTATGAFAECGSHAATAKAAVCLRADPEAAMCLVNGGTPCACLTVSTDTKACFGHCFGAFPTSLFVCARVRPCS